MEQSVLEMAKDLVKAQIQAGHLAPDAVQNALHETHTRLTTLQAREGQAESGVAPLMGVPYGSTDWRKSITRLTITCLECNASFKQLSIRHLREHNLDAQSYRKKYGIPRTMPLAAKATTARRRQVVQETRPWEKTPRYLEGQAGKAAVAQEPTVAQKSRKTGTLSAGRKSRTI